eukprot:jgi/Orpsp1_1/1178590/evm.model.c7180000065964.1
MSIKRKSQELFKNIQNTKEMEEDQVTFNNIQNSNKNELNNKIINKKDLNKDQETFDNIQNTKKNKSNEEHINKEKILLIFIQIIEIILEFVGIETYSMKSDSDINPLLFLLCYPPSLMLLTIMIYSLLSNSSC